MIHKSELLQGRIINRPNRFLANVMMLDGKTVEAHTPVSGRIGGLTVDNLPCLLSGPYEGRRTTYTVEAIGLAEGTEDFQWIGINQTSVNSVVEELLKSENLAPFSGAGLKREVKLGKRRIDFRLADKTWLEIKMPLLKIHAKRLPKTVEKEFPPLSPSDRLPEQLKEIAATGDKAALIVCFQYANNSGSEDMAQLRENILPADVASAIEAGLELWRLELSFQESGLELKVFHKIDNMIS